MFIIVTALDGEKILVQKERIQKVTTFKGNGSITFIDSNGGGGVDCVETPEQIYEMIGKE